MTCANGFDADRDVYRTLLESTKAIPWKIDWHSMTFSYIGPQIEALLGWSPDSWTSVNDWVERMHPEDRERVVDFCVSQSQAGTDHEADYRALTKSGDYVWIRDVVHVVRNERGEVESLVGFMFDISERKQTEQRLLQLQKELEALSFRDGLTGVANRRMFDKTLEQEWADARRRRQPLSLVLLDIDCFKEYNDHFGHIQGDNCLIMVAQTLNRAATRPRDFVGRYGGEEFVLILPESDTRAARTVAERCQQLLGELGLSHPDGCAGPTVTLSLGVSTLIPGEADSPLAFLESVDRLLYRAKQRGRNRIEYG
ncbi:diguanylate cyclase domain-containing protein [Zobellella sp. DQSA1]|uniref:sensor domain-containing diguanylate cyclase n=1 Tax=Zobellella sp. DQSA1 TaxID=3342386 RepID=UPI0035C1C7D5